MRILAKIKQALTTAPSKDEKPFPLVQMKYLGRTGDGVLCFPFGHHANPKEGTPCLMLTIGNDESNRYLIPLSAKVRNKGLKENEAEFGNFVIGTTIKFDEDGNMIVTSSKDIIVNCSGKLDINVADEIEITVPKITLNGDFDMVGDLEVNGNIRSNGINLDDHVHSDVESGVDNTGPPV